MAWCWLRSRSLFIWFQRRNTSLNADHLRGGSSSARAALVLLMLWTMLPVRRSQREPLIAGCSEVDPVGSLAQSNAALTVSPIFLQGS